MGTAVKLKHPVPDRVTNDGLTWSGTGCFTCSCTHMATDGVKGLTGFRLAAAKCMIMFFGYQKYSISIVLRPCYWNYASQALIY